MKEQGPAIHPTVEGSNEKLRKKRNERKNKEENEKKSKVILGETQDQQGSLKDQVRHKDVCTVPFTRTY